MSSSSRSMAGAGLCQVVVSVVAGCSLALLVLKLTPQTIGYVHISEMETVMSNFSSILQKCDKEYKTTKSGYDELKNKEKILTEEKGSLESTNKELASELESTKNQLTEANKAKDVVKQKEEELKKITSERDDMKSERDKIKSELEEKIKVLEEKVQAVEENNSQIQNEPQQGG